MHRAAASRTAQVSSGCAAQQQAKLLGSRLDAPHSCKPNYKAFLLDALHSERCSTFDQFKYYFQFSGIIHPNASTMKSRLEAFDRGGSGADIDDNDDAGDDDADEEAVTFAKADENTYRKRFFDYAKKNYPNTYSTLNEMLRARYVVKKLGPQGFANWAEVKNVLDQHGIFAENQLDNHKVGSSVNSLLQHHNVGSRASLPYSSPPLMSRRSGDAITSVLLNPSARSFHFVLGQTLSIALLLCTVHVSYLCGEACDSNLQGDSHLPQDHQGLR